MAGSTGLVGRAVVERLLRTPEVRAVHALVRRAWPDAPRGEGLVVRPFDFDRQDATPDALDVDAIVCALGTTMRAAGSRAAFRLVDHGYPVALAAAGRAAGARHFQLVSSAGADAHSRIFYSRVKGETEAAVRTAGYPSLTIARPSLLLGTRSERRLGESIGKALGVFWPPRWRPVHASQVAAALVDALLRRAPGVEVLENPALRRFAA